MRLIQRLALLVPIVMLWTACTTSKESKPLALEDLIDKQILPIHNSLNNIRDKNIRKSFFPILHGLLKEFPNSRDSASHAILALDLCANYSSMGLLDSAMPYAYESLPYFESHPEFQFPLMRNYQILSMAVHFGQGNIFLANRYATKAAALCQLPGMDSLQSRAGTVQVLFTAASTNIACEQMDEGVHLAETAYRLVRQAPDSVSAFIHYRTLFELSDAYLQARQFDSAQKYIGVTEQWVTSKNLVGGEAGIKALKSNYYTRTQQYDSALFYLSDIKNVAPLPYIYCKLNAYTALHRPVEAAKYFQEAEDLIHHDTSVNKGNNEYYKYRTQYLILYGDRQNAWKSLLVFDSLNKEKYGKDRLDMYASIEPEYNLADKQKRLERLGKANKAAEDELRRKNTLLLVSVLVILLVSLTVIALLLLARQRKLRSEKKILETERNKIELEQRLLRTQMEPHFIFNTLSVLQSQIHNQETDRASTYLNHFARLLRTSLENSRENFVPLQEEVEALEAYLSLQQMRFEHAFDYDIQLYPGFEEDDVQILPMLLQPFVENAIQYGRGSADRRLFIMVNIYVRDNVLYCSIENNGERVEETAAKAKKKSLSTQIIRERLAIVSRQTGKEARLTVQDTEILGHAGTRVTIVFPLLTEAAVQQLKDGVPV